MITELLRLERPLIIFDFETTGVGPQARAVELAFEVHLPGGDVKPWRSLINPELSISEAATKVHGITDEMMKGCRKCSEPASHVCHSAVADPAWHEFVPVPTFKQLAPNLARRFSGCDLAGKQVRFDIGVMAYEMTRAGQSWSAAGARIICCDRLEQLGEPRDLASLYKRRTGKDLIGAHGAAADVAATSELLEAQLLAFGGLPRDLSLLHAAQWKDWIDSEGLFKRWNGMPTCSFGKHKGTAMRNVPRGYWEWMLTSTFSDEVKALVSDALKGRFPEG